MAPTAPEAAPARLRIRGKQRNKRKSGPAPHTVDPKRKPNTITSFRIEGGRVMPKKEYAFPSRGITTERIVYKDGLAAITLLDTGNPEFYFMGCKADTTAFFKSLTDCASSWDCAFNMLKKDGKAASYNVFEDSQLLLLTEESPVKIVFNGDVENFKSLLLPTYVDWIKAQKIGKGAAFSRFMAEVGLLKTFDQVQERKVKEYYISVAIEYDLSKIAVKSKNINAKMGKEEDTGMFSHNEAAKLRRAARKIYARVRIIKGIIKDHKKNAKILSALYLLWEDVKWIGEYENVMNGGTTSLEVRKALLAKARKVMDDERRASEGI